MRVVDSQTPTEMKTAESHTRNLCLQSGRCLSPKGTSARSIYSHLSPRSIFGLNPPIRSVVTGNRRIGPAVHFTDAFLHLLTHSFARSLIHALTHSLVHTLTYSLNQTLIPLLTLSFTHALTRSLTRPRTHAFAHSLVYSLTVSLTYSFTHAVTQSRTHSLIHSLTLCLTHPCLITRSSN